VCPVRNGTHGSTLTGGRCAVVEVVLQLGPGDVSTLGFNVVPIHMPSGWLSVIDDEAFWCAVGWGRLGQYPVGRLLVVAMNHSWSRTLIRNHQQTALAVV
jgi:predicted NAD/FAD-dependent oxidoreductase